MFTTQAFPTTFTAPTRFALRATELFTNLNRYTVASGAFIGSAILGRLLAWQSGGVSVAQLAFLLLVASAAGITAWLARAKATGGTLDNKLANLALRAGGVQTVLAVVTLYLAIG
jgi:hypothetical protein